MQQDILLIQDIHDPAGLDQVLMDKWLCMLLYIIEHTFGKFHKILKVVYPSSLVDIIGMGQSQPFDQVVQQVGIYIPVADKPGGPSLLTVLQTFFNGSDDVHIDVIINIQLCIPGNFYNMARAVIETKRRKDIRQVIADDILQQDNVLLTRF